jgi:2-isopropylmalate synthase
LVLGKHSGRHALRARLVELGYELSEADLNTAFERFKQLADKKKSISDADLEALIEDQAYQVGEIYTLDGLQVACGTMGMPTATVRLRDPEGKVYVVAAVGTGPVDAAYKAIDAIVDVKNTLLEFNVHAVTEGIDAIGEVTVRLVTQNGASTQRTSPQTEETHARSFGGYGADTDIIVAAAKAYLAALNKALAARSEPHSSSVVKTRQFV